jgi:hypothetical protein
MSIHENMPAEEYFAVEAASNSGLKLIRRSPAHFKNPEPDKKDSRAKEIGSALHMALLEPEKYAKTYHVAEADLRTDAFYRGMAKDIGGSVVLTRPESRKILGMQAAAYRNKRFAAYMAFPGRNELSVFTTDPETGVPMKCRFDRKGDSRFAFDVKKCQDARGEEFVKPISNYGYFQQVAFYQHVWFCETGERIQEFPLIAIEEDSPHGVICHDLDEIALELGRIHYREALETYARCMDSGVWPAYADESEVTSVTSWMANELLGDVAFGGV